MRKLILGIGSIACVVAPVASVLSCGVDTPNTKPTNSYDYKMYFEYEMEDGRVNEDNNKIVIDLVFNGLKDPLISSDITNSILFNGRNYFLESFQGTKGLVNGLLSQMDKGAITITSSLPCLENFREETNGFGSSTQVKNIYFVKDKLTTLYK